MNNQRIATYDVMRIIACFCVIMIHSAVFEQDSIYAVQSSEFLSIKFWGVIARWAVPAFVMLSGMFILPHADETSIKKLFGHRVLRMLIAYIAWSAVYSFYNTFVLGNVYAPTKLKTFIDGCFSGELHMWYLPMVAGLYIAAPILTVIIKNIGEKWAKYWILGLFIFTSIIPLRILYQVGFGISLFHPIISVPIVSLVTFIFAALVIWIIRKIPIIGTYIA